MPRAMHNGPHWHVSSTLFLPGIEITSSIPACLCSLIAKVVFRQRRYNQKRWCRSHVIHRTCSYLLTEVKTCEIAIGGRKGEFFRSDSSPESKISESILMSAIFSGAKVCSRSQKIHTPAVVDEFKVRGHHHVVDKQPITVIEGST